MAASRQQQLLALRLTGDDLDAVVGALLEAGHCQPELAVWAVLHSGNQVICFAGGPLHSVYPLRVLRPGYVIAYGSGLHSQATGQGFGQGCPCPGRLTQGRQDSCCNAQALE